VFYGHDVGYVVERIVLDDNIEAISATQLRRLGTSADVNRQVHGFSYTRLHHNFA
jgi:hypothetical protein